MVERLGFAGLGIMGGGMASNLIHAGYGLKVWNRTISKTEPLAALGATVVDSPAALADSCDVLFVCVSDTPDVEGLVFNDLFDHLRAGMLVVDHSTISPAATVKLAEAVATKDAHWLDAPVSGGAEGAKRGTLSIMVGGDDAQLERVRPYLEKYGTAITHMGPVGAGQAAKLVNQILVVVNQLAVSEALLLAKAAGLDLTTTIEAVKNGAAGSWMLANRGPQMVAGDWRPGFTIDLQQKDLRLVLEAADELGAPLPGTALVFQLYRALQNQGLGGEGNHALVKALEKMSGINLQ